MRLAILADIHGNLPALEAVLADAEQQGVDGIVMAGDLTFGPQAAEALDRLHGLGAWMIHGNNDAQVLALASLAPSHPWRVNRQFAVLRWQHAHLTQETLASMASLPEERVLALPDADPIRVVHGAPGGPALPLVPDRDAVALSHMRAYGLRAADAPPPLNHLLAGVEERVLICGHTHVPWQQQWDGHLALNPGSAGASLTADPRARYALLTWHAGRWQVEQRAVPYDLGLLEAAFEKSGLLAEGGAFARACLLWYETGHCVTCRLLDHAYRLAAAAGLADCEAVPDDIWEQAVATFDWPA